MLNVFVGILIAQLGIPLGFLIGGTINGMIPLNQGILALIGSVNAILLTSLFGLIYSIPASLIIGIPSYYVLKKFGKLNILGILAVAILIPISVSILLGGVSFQFISLTLPMAITGAAIFWFYLKSTGALTSSLKHEK